MERVLSLLLLTIYLVNPSYGACILTTGYTVHIQNQIPVETITLHCQSKDTELGNHTLTSTSYFEWKFCQNLIKTTLYSCHFEWGSKKQFFDVFTKAIGNVCTFRKISGTGKCNWEVRSDGFWFYSKKKWTQKYSWGS